MLFHFAAKTIRIVCANKCIISENFLFSVHKLFGHSYLCIIQCHQHMFEMSKRILRSPYVSNKTIKHFQLFAYFLLQVSSFSFCFSKKGYAKLRQVNFYMTLFDCIWHFCLKLRFTAFYFTTPMYLKISSALFLFFFFWEKKKRISMRIFSPLRLSPCYHRLVCAISQQSCFMGTQTIHSNLFSIFCVCDGIFTPSFYGRKAW